MTKLQAAALIAVIALVTAALRAAPFVLLRGKGTLPHWLERLTGLLPPAVMGMLVVYCLRSLDTSSAWPTLLSCALVAALHVWKRNSLLSIAGGTAAYMILIHVL